MKLLCDEVVIVATAEVEETFVPGKLIDPVLDLLDNEVVPGAAAEVEEAFKIGVEMDDVDRDGSTVKSVCLGV